MANSDLAERQLAFWSLLADAAVERGFLRPTPAARSWRHLRFGAAGATIVAAVSFRDNYVECKFALQTAPRAAVGGSSRELFDELLAERAAIERELGFTDLTWGGRTSTRVYRRWPIDLQDANNWHRATQWLIGTATRFRSVFGRRVLPAARVPGTIGELFVSLRDEFGLVLDEGRFEATAATPSMPRLGLYSSDREPMHRYAFATWWGDGKLGSTLTWVLLNPATGDTDGRPRPILTGCRHRAERWGYSGLIIINLFAYRARDPRELSALRPAAAIGQYNDAVITKVSRATAATVAAWGDHGTLMQRGHAVRAILTEPKCLPKPHATLSGKHQPFYPKGIRLDAPRVELT